MGDVIFCKDNRNNNHRYEKINSDTADKEVCDGSYRLRAGVLPSYTHAGEPASARRAQSHKRVRKLPANAALGDTLGL